MRVEGVGFKVSGLRFRIKGLGLGFFNSRFRIEPCQGVEMCPSEIGGLPLSSHQLKLKLRERDREREKKRGKNREGV